MFSGVYWNLSICPLVQLCTSTSLCQSAGKGNKSNLVTALAYAVEATYPIKYTFNSLQCNKILVCSKLKAFAEDRLNVTEKGHFFFEKVENTVEKKKMVVTRLFFFSLNVIKKPLPWGQLCDKEFILHQMRFFFPFLIERNSR